MTTSAVKRPSLSVVSDVNEANPAATAPFTATDQDDDLIMCFRKRGNLKLYSTVDDWAIKAA